MKQPDKRWALERLVAHAIDAVKEISEYERGRTELYVSLAETLVLIRQKHTYNGAPDLAGRSADYRATAAKIYAEAGILEDSATSIQAAVRYHIGNLLREEHSPEQLQAAGLDPKAPRTRARERQSGQTAAAATQPASVNLRDRSQSELIWDAVKAVEEVDPEKIDTANYQALLELQLLLNKTITAAQTVIENQLAAAATRAVKQDGRSKQQAAA